MLQKVRKTEIVLAKGLKIGKFFVKYFDQLCAWVLCAVTSTNVATFLPQKKALQNLINPQALEQIHKNGWNSPTRKFGKSFTAPIKPRHSGIKYRILNTSYY